MADISVIVPVYNVEPYLEECLDSLRAQTHENMEFLCINDGSTDRSLEILRRYAETDSRIRVIDKRNEGYGKTMNRGLKLASSPWIGIVESDDFVEGNMFETLYRAAEGSTADIIKCNFYKYTEKEGSETQRSREYPEALYGKEFCPLLCPEVYEAHSSIWAGIYRKEFLDQNRIRFHETPGASYQDISFHFQALSCAERMKLIEDALIYYRTDNIGSSVHNPDKVFCISDEMHRIEDYINGQTMERQAALWPVFARKKFYDYRWNYLRLAPEFQYAFLRLMSEEFFADEKAKKFEKVRWINEYNRDELYEIIKEPGSFFMRTKKKRYVDERIRIAGTSDRKIYLKGVLQEIRESKRTVLYGAGVRGKRTAEKLMEKGVPASKLVFGVTRKGAEEEALGIRVEEIRSLASCGDSLFVIITVKEDTQMELLLNLKRLGIENVVLAGEEFMEALEAPGAF